MNRIYRYSILTFIVILLVSCNAKDDPNALINTQFASEIIDSCHILSPKTYTYLQNIKPPLGIKPVVVTCEKIEESQMGNYADDLFDQFSKKKYSGNTFQQRGVLIVVSKDPQLVQVRVGKTYAIYCRMRGSAGGKEYLQMQQEVATRGVNEMCLVALNNTLKDIEKCRDLSWYNKIALKMSFVNVEMFMDDLATPSESFFSQFYFRPFLLLFGGLRSVWGSWILAFLCIAIIYTLIKNAVEQKVDDYIVRKARKDSDDPEDYFINLKLYNLIKTVVFFLIKLIITVPTLAALSVLSTSRTEDIIALQYAHIPTVDTFAESTQWVNSSPGIWLVLCLMFIYYLKFLLCGRGLFSLSLFPESAQQQMAKDQTTYLLLEDTINLGYNRHLIQGLFKQLFNIVFSALLHHEFQEIESNDVETNTNEADDEGKPKKRLIDLFFMDSDTPLFKKAPCLAVMINTHREALVMTFFVGVTAIMLFSYPYAIYFLILWIVQFLFRAFAEVKYLYKNFRKNLKHLIPTQLIRVKEVWMAVVIFPICMIALFLIVSPSYAIKTTEAIDVSHVLPDSFEGLYFVSKADGENVKGVTARILQDKDGAFYMQVYSDNPIQRYEFELDEEEGVFHSKTLGDGYITYDEQTKSITINFSERWILTN